MMTGTITRHTEHDDTIVASVATWVEAEPGHPSAVTPGQIGDGWVAADGEWPPPDSVKLVVVAAGSGHPDAAPVPPGDARQRVAELNETVETARRAAVDKDTAEHAARRDALTKAAAAIPDKPTRAAFQTLIDGGI